LTKALKKAKEEVGRLTNKNEESQKTITKLRETLRFSFPKKEHNKLLQEKYHLENKVQEADQNASLAEDEVITYVEKNTKLSELNTKLMIALNNSKGSQDALVKQISDNVATGITSSFLIAFRTSSHLLPGAKASTPKPLSKKELKKLRQKTKKRLINMQAKEAEDIPGDDDNLNNSVEELINPDKNSLDTNDNCKEDSSPNNNEDPLDTLMKDILMKGKGGPLICSAAKWTSASTSATVGLLSRLRTPAVPAQLVMLRTYVRITMKLPRMTQTTMSSLSRPQTQSASPYHLQTLTSPLSPLLSPASTTPISMAWLASPPRTPELSTPWREKISQSR
jgi:hypothetical protein